MAEGVKLTPMMAQYYEIKKKYLDTILLFRMGDFYEVFFEDAKQTSKVLNIALTHRGKLGETPIPMAGIPHHAAATYIDRITGAGHKVAICEQIEDPKEAKGIVKRAVTQVVSPALPYDLEKTQKHEKHYIVSGAYLDKSFYLTAIDFTTGEFVGHKINSEEEFLDMIQLYSPREYVGYFSQWTKFPKITEYFEKSDVLITNISEDYFAEKFTSLYIEKLIPSYKSDKVIKLYKQILSPVGALSYYICSTQDFEEIIHINPFRIENSENFLKVTLPTLTGLEILPKSRDQYKDSLLGFFDKTKTAMGSRYLRTTFMKPYADLDSITKRQDIIANMINNAEVLESIREFLDDVRDVERILAKVSTKKVNAGDLINLSKAFLAHNEVLSIGKKIFGKNIESLAKEENSQLKKLSDNIILTINDEIGAALEKGNLIKPGANKKRDRLARLSLDADIELQKLEDKYREETGIPKLKVKRNNVAGYFIEISKTHTDKVPKSYERRQTLVNSERYMTDELAEFEKEMIAAKDKLEKLEREIFKNIIDEVSLSSQSLQKLAKIISQMDLLQCLAYMAIQENLCRPEISANKQILNLKGAWHPLIKDAIKDQFVPHDITLNQEKFFGLITGPNMAGKTTVMREVAIIQLLAQLGSYVPAYRAELGICDYLFSRLGASDDILKGQSTFMVEMSETAEIVRHATKRSLIILDEVGRGTSTYDGLSIAWALVEHFIHNTKALTLFATHYHELIDVVDKINCAKNLTVETQNNGGDVQFLYRLIEQAASQSYGIYVAKLAGLPNSLLKRSNEILCSLEKTHKVNPGDITISEVRSSKPDRGTQLCFFPEQEPVFETPKYLKDLEKEVDGLDINHLTPLQALQKLNDLKDLLQ